MQSSNYSNRFKNALQLELNKVIDYKIKSIYEKYSVHISSCPVCDSQEHKVYLVKDYFVHMKCKKCNFIFLNPRLNENATFSFYNSEVNEIYNEKKFNSFQYDTLDDTLNLENFERLKCHVINIPEKKLLEIGPGKGTFLKKAAEVGFDVHAIELNVNLIERLKKITEKIYEHDIAELNLPDNYFDVIYFRDVMEHIPNIKIFMSNIARILKPGGIVFIDTHNIESYINKITKEYHTVIFAFEHPVHWSPKTLKLAGENSGLKWVKTYFDDIDFSMRNIINYYLYPSFTYINPPKINIISKFLLKSLSYFFRIPGISIFDRYISRKIALRMEAGAKMMLVFNK